METSRACFLYMYVFTFDQKSWKTTSVTGISLVHVIGSSLLTKHGMLLRQEILQWKVYENEKQPTYVVFQRAKHGKKTNPNVICISTVRWIGKTTKISEILNFLPLGLPLLIWGSTQRVCQCPILAFGLRLKKYVLCGIFCRQCQVKYFTTELLLH